MKTVLVFFASCLLAAQTHADLTIVQKVEGAGPTIDPLIKYKDGKTRIDVAAGTTILMDAKSGETISLLRAQKRYLKAPAGVVKAAIEGLNGSGPANSGKPELVPSGRKETIAGYPAEEYTASVAGSKITLWLTKTIPNYEQACHELDAAFRQGPLAAVFQNVGLDLSHLPGFLVRTISELRPGQPVTTTLISISTEPVSDQDFAIPADYTPIRRPELTPRAAVPASKIAKP